MTQPQNIGPKSPLQIALTQFGVGLAIIVISSFVIVGPMVVVQLQSGQGVDWKAIGAAGAIALLSALIRGATELLGALQKIQATGNALGVTQPLTIKPNGGS